MKLKEILASKTSNTTHDIEFLESHMTEVQWHFITRELIGERKQIELRFHMQQEHDGRCRDIFSVWFRGKVVMICMEGGRGGNDDRRTFVLSRSQYVSMYNYIMRHCRWEDMSLDISEFYCAPLTKTEFKF